MIKTSPSIKLGFSTGSLYKHYKIKQALEVLLKHHVDIVELGFIHSKVIPGQYNGQIIQSSDLSGFRYVSLHAPGDVSYKSDKESLVILNEIERINDLRPLDLVVFHPQEDMDLEMLKRLNVPIAFENMDRHKSFGRNPGDLAKLLDVDSTFQMVLDINHIYTNDKTMKLAKQFYERFPDRIVQIHASGFEKLHEAFFQTHQSVILEAIQDRSVPIIVESVIRPGGIDKERDYILNNLNSY